MSEAVPTPQPERVPEPPKKRRSHLERAIVWSAIAVLLGVMGVEAYARWSFERAYGPLAEKLRQADDSDQEVTSADVRAAVGGKLPAQTQRFTGITKTSNLEETYVWHGIFKRHTMYVYYGVGEDPAVLFVSKEQEPPPPAVPEGMAKMLGLSQPTSEIVQPAAAEAE